MQARGRVQHVQHSSWWSVSRSGSAFREGRGTARTGPDRFRLFLTMVCKVLDEVPLTRYPPLPALHSTGAYARTSPLTKCRVQVQNLHHHIRCRCVAPAWLRYGSVMERCCCILVVHGRPPMLSGTSDSSLSCVFLPWVTRCQPAAFDALCFFGSCLKACSPLACHFIFTLYLLGTGISFPPVKS
jgi:hypothetical protein